jgi:hypothetical protein
LLDAAAPVRLKNLVRGQAGKSGDFMLLPNPHLEFGRTFD